MTVAWLVGSGAGPRLAGRVLKLERKKATTGTSAVAFLGVSIVVYLDRIRRHMRPSVHTGHLNWNHSGISRLKFFNLVEYR